MMSRTRAAIVFLGLTAAALGCVTGPVTTERRPDGVYHLKCKTSLPMCLGEAEKICDRRHYAVLRAFDDHEYKGDPTFPSESRASEAFVRCGVRAPWGDENKQREQELCPATPATSPPAPPRGCTPGASQACAGPAGCQGGQVCAPDGATFGPCDCGAAPTPPASAAPMP